MASQSVIFGTIPGIAFADFQGLKPRLSALFQNIGWKNNVLYIRSEGRHPELKAIFTRIAGAMAAGAFGSLLYMGNQKVACIYFGRGNFEARLFREPKPPAWWGGSLESADPPA